MILNFVEEHCHLEYTSQNWWMFR